MSLLPDILSIPADDGSVPPSIGPPITIHHRRCGKVITRPYKHAWTCRTCASIWTENEILAIDRLDSLGGLGAIFEKHEINTDMVLVRVTDPVMRRTYIKLISKQESERLLRDNIEKIKI